jgi:peptidoglycan/LPS O-acetylase OafA/YrhL
MQYRADVDGLRGLAVIAVILNHLPEQYFPSGFLGVDIFFVISGFVVTASLFGTQPDNFRQFYTNFLARRIRRLWPALIICVALTSVTLLIFDPFPKASILTGIASLFGLANVALFYAEVDYFAASSKFNAFTHTWSLGVEEQFYIIFPIIFWFLTRSAKADTYALKRTLTILSLISLSLFALYYSSNQPAAYFLMPMRIWELGVGSLAFIMSATTGVTSHKASAVGPSLLTIVLLGCFLVPEEQAFLTTILAVTVTALLLVTQPKTPIQRLLSISALVYVGKISYSLYLYHWPIVSLAPLLLPEEWRISGLYIVALLLLSTLSYHLIESPFRKRSWSKCGGIDIAMGFGMSALLGATVYISMTMLESQRMEKHAAYPPAFLPLLRSGLPYNPNCVADNSDRPFTTKKFGLCTIAPKRGSEMPTLWLEGDSHAGHLQGLMHELHRELGMGIHLIETPGIAFPFSSPDRIFSARQTIHDKILENAKPGDVIAVSRLYFQRAKPIAFKPDIDRWIAEVSLLGGILKKRKLALVVIGPTPMFSFEDIRACNVDDLNSCSVSRATLETKIAQILEKLHRVALRHENVFVFDTFSSVCPKIDDSCYSKRNGTFIYRDRDHLNSFGSKLLAPSFVDFLRASGILARDE